MGEGDSDDHNGQVEILAAVRDKQAEDLKAGDKSSETQLAGWFNR